MPDPALVSSASGRLLSAAEFQRLGEVPPEVEWIANLGNAQTARAYRQDAAEFMAYLGVKESGELRQVTRSHVLAWRNELKDRRKADSTIRRKLSAVSSLFDYLCDRQTVAFNPVDGVKRPKGRAYQGKTPAISDQQARLLLDAPPSDTLKGKRDRAILSVLLYHGLRRGELVALKVSDYQCRQGVQHFSVLGKGNKIRYIPVHPIAQHWISEYLEVAGHRANLSGALFRPVKNNLGGLDKPLHPESVLQEVVLKYGRAVGITDATYGFCAHSLRATATTNALDNGADIVRVQMWLGHSDISTTRLYDRRGDRLEENPTFRVQY